MLSLVLYALLASSGNAAEIRRRQQELSMTAPRVIVQGQGPQMQSGFMQGPTQPSGMAQPSGMPPPSGMPQPSGPPQSQGTYFTRPPGPRPSSPMPSGGPVLPPPQGQNLVIPAPTPGSGPAGSGPPEDSTTSPGGSSNDDSNRKDFTNTPPALLGPNDTPGPASWADVLPNITPDLDDHSPEGAGDSGAVTPEVESSTSEAVNNLTEDQRSSLLENTSPTEFAESPPDFKELVLVAAQEKLADSEAKVESISETTAGTEAEPVTSLNQETYTDIQDIAANMTEKTAELSKTVRELIEVSLDELRSLGNDTGDSTAAGGIDESGNPSPAAKKRSVATIISTLTLLLELSDVAGQVVDGSISIWTKIKNAWF
ncbi:hypothetical protein TWF730_009872 [Orbilia blumenaviensis]|uniref:Uncharacterized protein n=1 Tax=Orbilia blumenaviensis TaxID=1796055 RepID=A0AAV9UTA8_9PEZI